jgi:hypothetical protein
MDEAKRRTLVRGASAVAALVLAGGVVGALSTGSGGGRAAKLSTGLSTTTAPGRVVDGANTFTADKGVARVGGSAGASGARATGGAAASPSRPSAGGDSGAPLGGPSLPDTGQQKIVKTASLSVDVKRGDFRRAFDAAASVAAAHGGYVVSSNSSVAKGETSSGTLVLRVPAGAFDATRAELSKLGSLRDESISGEDVGGQLVDLDARIRSLQAQEDAIRALMAKATTVGETIEIQGQLSQVRQQIEQLSGEKARLDNAAELSTITVQLAEPGAALDTPPKPRTEAQRNVVAHSFKVAGRGIEVVTAGIIILLGWLSPLALLALVVWGLRKLLDSRRPRPGPAAL